MSLKFVMQCKTELTGRLHYLQTVLFSTEKTLVRSVIAIMLIKKLSSL